MAGRYVARYGWLVIALTIFGVGITLLAIGRAPICPCGTVRLWTGMVQGPENSQQLTDWCSLSHIVHGLLFYGAGWLALRRWPVVARLALESFSLKLKHIRC